MPDLDLKTIGERVLTQRNNLGFSRDQLAEKVGISVKFCSDIEHGLRGMSYQTIYNMARALHFTADFLLTGVERDNEMAVESIVGMIQKCPTRKLKYIEGIILNFMEAEDE
jgi:transcriptional regulator with XRE-family HTH domain